MATAPEFRAAAVEGVRLAAQAAARYLILDLAQVTFFGRAGGYVLVEVHDLSEAEGVNLRVVPSRTVRRLLQLTQIELLLELSVSVDEALNV